MVTIQLDASANIYTVYSFRITDDQTYTEQFINNIKKYLKRYQIDILYSTAGIHKLGGRPHFHYHLVCNEPEGYKRPKNDKLNQHFRNFLKLKENSEMRIPPSKGQCLKYEIRDDQDLRKSLMYPLKEELPIQVGCFLQSIDLEELVNNASLLFSASSEVKKKKRATELAELSKKCMKHLDEYYDYIKSCAQLDEYNANKIINPYFKVYEEAILMARKFYIEEGYFTPNTPSTCAMKWLNKVGLLTNRDFITLYSPLGRLR
jgi:hypothetical protein